MKEVVLFCAVLMWWYFMCFKQQTAYELRISDWSSDVSSSDLGCPITGKEPGRAQQDGASTDARDMARLSPDRLDKRQHVRIIHARNRSAKPTGDEEYVRRWNSFGDRKSTRLNSSH